MHKEIDRLQVYTSKDIEKERIIEKEKEFGKDRK